MRNIIDLLRKGNQELFHSSMIAWLLDPNAEHSLGRQFLIKFAEKVDNKLLELAKSSSRIKVNTEEKSSKGRYDIAIHFGDTKAVIENKTKTIGYDAQLDRYKDEKTIVVALGLCDVSYMQSVTKNYPFLTYRDILEIIKDLHLPKQNDKFSMLISDYQEFLEREFDILDMIDEYYVKGNLECHAQVNDYDQEKLYTDNDWRFWNLYLLEKFRRFLEVSQYWKNSGWSTSKDMISGVWLANLGSAPSIYSFKPTIEHLHIEKTEGMWFHIELNPGIQAAKLEDEAAQIKLKCRSLLPKESFIREFKSVYETEKGEYFTTRRKTKDVEFYIIQIKLSKKELQFKQLEERLTAFARQFGSFSTFS